MLAITEAARWLNAGMRMLVWRGTEDRIHPVQRLRQHLSERLGKGVPFKDTGAVPAKAAVLIVESLEHATAETPPSWPGSPASPEDNRPTAPAMVVCPKMILVRLSHGTGDGRCGGFGPRHR